MRAYDMALILIILQASIGFVNGLGIFDRDYYATQNNTYTQYRVANLTEYNPSEGEGLADYVADLARWVVDGLKLLFKVVGAVFIIYPTLTDTFGVPSGLSILLQGGIYVIYIMGWVQWKSNKGMRQFE